VEAVGLREWVIPREDKFFDLLEKESLNVVAAAEQLVELFGDYGRLSVFAKRIEELEHVGDSLVHDISVELNRSFITPFDHSDIAALAGRIDDILDYIDASTQRLSMYKIDTAPPHAQRLAQIILDQVREIDAGVQSLRKMDSAAIQRRRIVVNRLENEADDATNVALVEAFELENVKTIMKLKEVYEHLEIATDRCEDASDVLADIATKNA
jgi:uncharacterized protein Yka (UPF0111/DUF47 family)